MITSWKQRRSRRKIDAVCPGYSGPQHWKFFSEVFSDPAIRDICILGVYRGRDLAYIATIMQSLGRKDFRLIGVDKFEDAYCDDWPEEKRQSNWREAGFGDPPDIDIARSNLLKLNLDQFAHLHRARAEDFLTSSSQAFDFIYIDIAHDYQSTIKMIDLAVQKVTPHGFIAGDDFSDQGTWGVASAVRDSFGNFEVFSNWLWRARRQDFLRNR